MTTLLSISWPTICFQMTARKRNGSREDLSESEQSSGEVILAFSSAFVFSHLYFKVCTLYRLDLTIFLQRLTILSLSNTEWSCVHGPFLGYLFCPLLLHNHTVSIGSYRNEFLHWSHGQSIYAGLFVVFVFCVFFFQKNILMFLISSIWILK